MCVCVYRCYDNGDAQRSLTLLGRHFPGEMRGGRATPRGFSFFLFFSPYFYFFCPIHVASTSYTAATAWPDDNLYRLPSSPQHGIGGGGSSLGDTRARQRDSVSASPPLPRPCALHAQPAMVCRSRRRRFSMKLPPRRHAHVQRRRRRR